MFAFVVCTGSKMSFGVSSGWWGNWNKHYFVYEYVFLIIGTFMHMHFIDFQLDQYIIKFKWKMAHHDSDTRNLEGRLYSSFMCYYNDEKWKLMQSAIA